MGGKGSGEGERRVMCGLFFGFDGVAKGLGRDGLDARCEDEEGSGRFILFLTGENGFEVEMGGSTLIARDLGTMDDEACCDRLEGGVVEGPAA